MLLASINDLPVVLRPVLEATAQAVLRGHAVLLTGPPGMGATMIARRLVTLLPPLTGQERVEITWRYIAAGIADGPAIARPFRAPHYTASSGAMTGAPALGAMTGASAPGLCGACRGRGPITCRCRGRGTVPGKRYRPGELQLAHGGVLFLNDVPEFPRAVLDTVRAAWRRRAVQGYPCTFALVGSAPLCPCGWHGSGIRACTCTAGARTRYAARHVQDLFDVQTTLPSMEVMP